MQDATIRCDRMPEGNAKVLAGLAVKPSEERDRARMDGRWQVKEKRLNLIQIGKIFVKGIGAMFAGGSFDAFSRVPRFRIVSMKAARRSRPSPC
ncbi:MAG: hypothetical protein ACRYGL_02725 [Janthinobacterium lividum]